MLSQFDSTTSGNAGNGRKLKRMEFKFKNESYKFALNPEEYTQNEPMRVNLTQTKGGAWIDTWGAGIVEISIKGTTGVTGGGKSTDIDVGYQRFKKLRNLIREVYTDVSDGEEVKDLLGFYNYTDNEYYWCYPKADGIELYRSKSRPHVYQYSISLYALRRIGEGVTSSQTLGNPNKTTTDADGNSTTTTSSSSQHAGGTATITDYNKLSESEADKVVQTIVRSKANADLISDAKLYCGNLEPIIGGKNGKLSPVTAWQCTNGLNIASTGTIVNVPSITLADVTDETGWLYNAVLFNSAVSIDTYEMANSIKDYESTYLSTEFMTLYGSTQKERIVASVASSTNYSSTLFVNAQECRTKSYIGKADFSRIKTVMLECMRVYCEIYKIADIDDYSDTISANLTTTQMQDLIENLQALILYLKFTETDYNQLYRIDLLSDLRHLEKIMTQINKDIVIYL